MYSVHWLEAQTGWWTLATGPVFSAKSALFLRLSVNFAELGIGSAVNWRLMNGKRVLVVDDSFVDARLLSTRLKAEGFEVLVAPDGAAAVSTARKQKLDLIFLDVLYPPDVAHGGGVSWD